MTSTSHNEHRALEDALGAHGLDAATLARHVRDGVDHWMHAVVRGASNALEAASQVHAVAADRCHIAPALSLLKRHREGVVARLARGVQQQLDEGERLPRAALPPAEPDAPLKLTLIGEAQIDEDIEIARIVQAIETEAGVELRLVASLVSGLRGLPGIDLAANPLPPLACAGGLRAGLAELVPKDDLRLFLLRKLGAALGLQLKQVYAELAGVLQRAGVRPARFRVKPTVPPRASGVGSTHGQGTPGSARPVAHRENGRAGDAVQAASAALWQLVERARSSLRLLAAPDATAAASGAPQLPQLPQLPQAPQAPQALSLRLFDEPQPAAQHSNGIDPAAAVLLMERLFTQIEEQLGHAPGVQALLVALREPGRALAARETQLWSSADHPWWRLLDRLIAEGSVNDDDAAGADSGLVTQSLALVVERMHQGQSLDRAGCQAAVDELQRASKNLHSERGEVLASRTSELERSADRDEVETELRRHIVHQLHVSPVCAGLRQFLVGPWAQAMALATLRHGTGSAAMDQLALVVDDLIRATAQPGKRVSKPQRTVLLRQVEQGLNQAELPAARVDAELADLAAMLRDPPPLQEDGGPIAADNRPVQTGLDMPADLPTVPIDMDAADTTMEVAGHQSWLDSLAPGAYCRLFLLGRWMNAQLSWVSPSHNLFLFTSRHGGRTHSLTRRMLGKLRSAGLATRIEEGHLLAQAMQDLADTGFDEA